MIYKSLTKEDFYYNNRSFVPENEDRLDESAAFWHRVVYKFHHYEAIFGETKDRISIVQNRSALLTLQRRQFETFRLVLIEGTFIKLSCRYLKL